MLKATKKDIVRFILSAIVGAVFWTASLTPYMVFVVKMRWDQIPQWIAMQFMIIPPLAPIAVWIDKKVVTWIMNKFV